LRGEIVHIACTGGLDFMSLLHLMNSQLLDQLKRRPGAEQAIGSRRREDLRVQLYFQSGGAGAYLRLIDGKGRAIQPDPVTVPGTWRSFVRTFQDAITRKLEAVEWQEDGGLSDGVSLAAFPQLLHLLHTCPEIVDAEGSVLSLATESYHPQLRVTQTGEDSGRDFATMLELQHADGSRISLEDFRVVDAGHLLMGSTIYPVGYLGSQSAILHLFADRVPPARIGLFLTLFASNFPDVPLVVDGFVGTVAGVIEARPALVFRDVDAEANLIIETSYKVGDLPADFVRDYEISRLVSLDPSERRFRVCDVDYSAALEAREVLGRDLQKMRRKVKGAGGFLHADADGSFVLGADLATHFLAESLAGIASRFILYGAEKLGRYRIVHAQPKLSTQLSSGIDFLEGEASLEIEGERISLLEALNQFRKNTYIELSDGRHAVVDQGYMARLSRLFKRKKDGIRVSFFDLPEIDALSGAAAESAPFQRSRKIYEELNSLDQRSLRLTRFSGTLRPYQSYGVRWLDYLYAHRIGGCLADDMGLGKTVQAIALFTRIYPKVKTPSLIVMPRSLLFNWSQEFAVFAPELSVCQYYGPDRDWDAARQHSIILTTYGTLRADAERVTAEPFHAVVLDESQAVKNIRTQTSRAVCALQAEFRLALSGTPIENNLTELYALFRFLNPAMFPTYADFERDYILPIQKQQDSHAASELRRKIYPFILRRLKGDVLKDLPPKVEQRLYVEMNERQKAHYENRRTYYQQVIRGEIDRHGLAKSQFAILEALLELRQIATIPEAKTDGAITSAKTERLLEALEEAIANGHKCLVFTNFLAGIEQVSEALAERGIEHLSMTGATSDRQSLVQRFQNDPAIQVFIMTLKTGGVGLNLTAADAVFILDPWWNHSAESQAVDRAHRIGQSNTVFTYRLITRGTIEEKIEKLQSQKKELVDQIVTTESAAFKHLSEGDINALFQD